MRIDWQSLPQQQMSEDRSSNGSGSLSWYDRLGLVLTGEPRDREHVLQILRAAKEGELLDAEALSMIEGVFQVAEMQVRDIMIPRSTMVVVPRTASLEDIKATVTRSGHSRFPVIDDSRDSVVGILLAKDLLRYSGSEGDEVPDLQDILRPPIFIPESKRLNVLLKEFRNSRNHMAIVIDEYGGVAGLVTIEDVLEQIVGEIDDEHDVYEDAYSILRHSDNRYTIKALTSIEDFNEAFGTEYSDEDYDTVGGLVMNAFGHLPKRDEVVTVDQFRFKVLHANNRRIGLLEMTIQPRKEDFENP
jgi:magnesium and cobalt transporter